MDSKRTEYELKRVKTEYIEELHEMPPARTIAFSKSDGLDINRNGDEYKNGHKNVVIGQFEQFEQFEYTGIESMQRRKSIIQMLSN